MGKGIKMRSARGLGGKKYTIEQLQELHDNDQPIPPLICTDLACGSVVRFVPRGQQNRSNRIEPVNVPAYIGLTSKSSHNNDCCYNVAKKLEAIAAAQSDPNFLYALDNGKRELRLLTLHNGLKGKSLSGHAPMAGGEEDAPPIGEKRSDYTPAEDRLKNYVSTTADIVSLRAVCESDDDIADELTLLFGKKKIRWSQFYFDHDRYNDAWKRVNTDGAEHAYPLALYGEVYSHKKAAQGTKYPTSFLNCRALYMQPDGEFRHVVNVSIGHQDFEWLEKFPVGSKIVMFGLWKSTEKKDKDTRDPKGLRMQVTHNLVLYPRFKRQIVTA